MTVQQTPPAVYCTGTGSTCVSAAAWTFEEVRALYPLPTLRPSHTPHPPAPHRDAELNHTRPASAHALVGAGECSVALYGVARRRCRVSLPPPSAVLGGRGARSPRRHRGLSAARLPLLTAQTALPTQAAGWAAVGSSGYCRRASGGRSERSATPSLRKARMGGLVWARAHVLLRIFGGV